MKKKKKNPAPKPNIDFQRELEKAYQKGYEDGYKMGKKAMIKTADNFLKRATEVKKS
jgi:hypothetical protein